MILSLRRCVLLATCFGLLAGCERWKKSNHHDGSTTSAPMHGSMMAAKTAVAHVMPSKAATTQPSNNNVAGTVTFTDLGNGQVKVVADITGFEPNSTHGFHVHEKGDLSAADLSSAGGHYNPDTHIHGGPATSPVHAGDLGNIAADASGNAHYEIEVNNISIGGKNDIVGKSVIIHAKPDDLKSQPAGNAGGRVAGGVIEAARDGG